VLLPTLPVHHVEEKDGEDDGEDERQQADDARRQDAAQAALVEVLVDAGKEGVEVRDGLPPLLDAILQQRAHLHLH